MTYYGARHLAEAFLTVEETQSQLRRIFRKTDTTSEPRQTPVRFRNC